MPNSVPNRQSIEEDLLEMIDSDRSFSVQEKNEQDASAGNGSFFNNHNYFNKQENANNFSVFEPTGFGFTAASSNNQTLDLSNSSGDMQQQKLTMNPTSACFVPKVTPASLDNSTTTSDNNSRGASPQKDSSGKNNKVQQENRDRFHAGASKWGKYKKKEKEAKRQQ